MKNENTNLSKNSQNINFYEDYDFDIEEYNGQNGYNINEKNNLNYYNKKEYQKSKYIKTENYPEFGTYFNKNEKTLFIPFSRYNENFPQFNGNCCLCYIYRLNSILDFPCFNIVIRLKSGMLKLVFELNSISNIVLGENNFNNIEKNENKEFIQTFFFYLNKPPKVYFKNQIEKNLKNEIEEEKKDNNNFFDKEFYFNSFKIVLDKYTYSNHYHFLEDNGLGDLKENKINIMHEKGQKEISYSKYQNFFSNENESNYYLRLDSFFSKKSEFLNFYLLNLIMKVTLKFKSIEEFNFIFKEHLKLYLIIQNPDFSNENFNSKILQSADKDEIKSTSELLKQYQMVFYKRLLNLHFSLQYSILSLITNKRMSIFNIEILNILNNFKDKSCIEQEILSLVIDSINKDSLITKNTKNIYEIVEKKFYQFLEPKNPDKLIFEKNKNDESLSLIRNIDITPTMIYYNIPKFEKNNQLIRKFSILTDHFIKVNILDETHLKIYLASRNYNKFLAFIKSLMTNGIIIGSRQFKFLTSSNTQIKSGCGWYFNLEGTKYKKIENIINEIGNFKNEKNKYKNIARRGQCASNSTPIELISPEEIIEIPDIKSPNEKYIYSDGIGQISLFLAKKCFEKMKKNNENFYCSAFQIRLLGIKGVLAINPKLPDEKILVRPSMKKFDSSNYELGIIKCSSYSTGYLNRQIISILCSLGVDKIIFIDMVKNILSLYYEFLYSITDNVPKKRKGNLILKGNTELRDEILSKCYYFKPLVNYYLFKEDYHKFNNEPFINQILLSSLALKVREIKSKCKIYDNHSACLMGVIDETGILKHNEVYIHINKSITKSFDAFEYDKIIEGEVFITKNPCLHPGDIRIVKAVSNNIINDSLSHMINVIVFSSDCSNNERPIPNQISGGDLDGDAYFVSWNKNILNNIKIRNYPPASDPKYNEYINYNNNSTFNSLINDSSILNKTSINMNDVVKTHIKIMKNDLVPKISYLHSLYADSDVEKGVFNEKCLKLSELFMIAIDSQKSGIFISEETLEKNKLVVNKFPDFLEIDKNSCYESPGILGQIYRLCDFDIFFKKFCLSEFFTSYKNIFEIDINLVTYNSIYYALDALKIYLDYCKEIFSLMKKYDVSSEVELFLNFDIHNSKNKKAKKDPPFKDIEIIQDKYNSYIKNIFGEINKDIASAIYLVTYMNEKAYRDNTDYFNETKEGKKFIIEWFKYNNHKNIPFGKYIESEIYFKDKKFFSLPWIIKEIRDLLFQKNYS